MATQLGELSIDAIETDKDQAVFVRGVFTSLHNKNVYVATRAGGARLLFDARESAGLPVISEADLEAKINFMYFETPKKRTTKFEIAISHDNRAIIEGLKPMAWDSYRLG
jgi:hypothetical protein